MAKTDLRKELEKEYRRLAKQADQRLVRIEDYAKKTRFKGVKKFEYRVAMRDIRSWSGSKAKRFNTKPPENTNQLKAKIADIKKFLQSDSSTLRKTKTNRGIIDIYESRAKTLNDNWGTNFTWQDMAKFFESSASEKIDNMMSSKAKMKAIGVIHQNKEKIKEVIKQKGEKHLQVEDEEIDDVVKFNVDKIINELSRSEVNKLFGSN